jgi:hypothetical protein
MFEDTMIPGRGRNGSGPILGVVTAASAQPVAANQSNIAAWGVVYRVGITLVRLVGCIVLVYTGGKRPNRQ